MKSCDLILFDLDGTLTDSGPGIMRAVRYSLEKLGLPALPEETLRRFIGPPLYDSYERFCGLSHDGAITAVAAFREYYKETGIFENSVYPGIPEALGALRSAGKTLAVATSKPQEAADRVLAHFSLMEYFSHIVGSTEDGSLILKADIIKTVLSRAREDGLHSPIMVGDREHDVIGARENGLDTIGVLYGYGSRAELESAGAAYIAEAPADIVRLVN